MKLDSQFDRDVIIYAFRYALTRNSYAPSLMQDKLDEIWSQLEDWDKDQILREAKESRYSVNQDVEWGNWARKKEREMQNDNS